eukprot:10786669-Ditylum_brightwellii.AAC.1
MSKEWAQEQDGYLVDVKLWTPWTNGSQWTVQVIKFLWDRTSFWPVTGNKCFKQQQKWRNF